MLYCDGREVANYLLKHNNTPLTTNREIQTTAPSPTSLSKPSFLIKKQKKNKKKPKRVKKNPKLMKLWEIPYALQEFGDSLIESFIFLFFFHSQLLFCPHSYYLLPFYHCNLPHDRSNNFDDFAHEISLAHLSHYQGSSGSSENWANPKRIMKKNKSTSTWTNHPSNEVTNAIKMVNTKREERKTGRTCEANKHKKRSSMDLKIITFNLRCHYVNSVVL